MRKQSTPLQTFSARLVFPMLASGLMLASLGCYSLNEGDLDSDEAHMGQDRDGGEHSEGKHTSEGGEENMGDSQAEHDREISSRNTTGMETSGMGASKDTYGLNTSHQDGAPMPGLRNADHLILPEENHFASLWQVTDGGENAEAYWSFDGKALSLQAKLGDMQCDQIYLTEAGGKLTQVSNGKGVTTCAYYLPNGESVLYASTHAAHETCPPRPDHSMGYVWALYPEFDIYARDLKTGEIRTLVESPGYDAEATVSPVGDRMVFTSTRTGDVELWTCNLDGSDPQQVTTALGYDGGAFYSPNGEWLVYRTTTFSPDPDTRVQEQAEYMRLLGTDLVRPSNMELSIIRPDGTGHQQVTELGGANFAPSFYPDNQRIIFASNHHDKGRPAMNFDLFAINPDGTELEQITFYNGQKVGADGMITEPEEGQSLRGKQFDSFPLFSPDGRYLAFSSNRGDGKAGDTNVFIAEWK